MVKILLRLEGLFVFLVTLILYYNLGFSWTILAFFILIPDLSILGYIKNKTIGVWCYNIVHNYIFSLIIVGVGLTAENELLLAVGIIFTMHVGIDRALGLGLKYVTGFKDTHLQKV